MAHGDSESGLVDAALTGAVKGLLLLVAAALWVFGLWFGPALMLGSAIGQSNGGVLLSAGMLVSAWTAAYGLVRGAMSAKQEDRRKGGIIFLVSILGTGLCVAGLSSMIESAQKPHFEAEGPAPEHFQSTLDNTYQEILANAQGSHRDNVVNLIKGYDPIKVFTRDFTLIGSVLVPGDLKKPLNWNAILKSPGGEPQPVELKNGTRGIIQYRDAQKLAYRVAELEHAGLLAEEAPAVLNGVSEPPQLWTLKDLTLHPFAAIDPLAKQHNLANNIAVSAHAPVKVLENEGNEFLLDVRVNGRHVSGWAPKSSVGSVAADAPLAPKELRNLELFLSQSR